MNATKTSYFEYFVNEIYKINGGINSNDLSVVKTQKLLFFLTISVQEEDGSYPLLKTFDKFYALPFGHVESDIYTAIKNKSLLHFEIDRFGSKKIISNIEHILLNQDIKTFIDLGIQRIKEYNLITRNATYLVDLSHCHESWIKNYREALHNNKASQSIPAQDIINEQKYFAL